MYVVYYIVVFGPVAPVNFDVEPLLVNERSCFVIDLTSKLQQYPCSLRQVRNSFSESEV